MKSILENPALAPFFHELSLRRIKEHPAPLRKSWRWPLALLSSFFSGSELVRHIWIASPPQRRHEWERQDLQRPVIY